MNKLGSLLLLRGCWCLLLGACGGDLPTAPAPSVSDVAPNASIAPSPVETPTPVPGPRELHQAGVGEIEVGKNVADIRHAGLRRSSRKIALEGDKFDQHEFCGDAQACVIAIASSDGNIFEVSTTSEAFSSREGARVGDTLADLLLKFPMGHVLASEEEGASFQFFERNVPNTDHGATGGVFEFDPKEFPTECFVSIKDCPAVSKLAKSRRYAVRSW